MPLLLARAAGTMLRAVFAAILVVRRPRPIHSRGRLLDGEIRWLGNPTPSGIGWIDEPPAVPERVLARLSRSVGLPAPLPDIIGLAFRFTRDGRPADVELASTGFGVPARFLLLPHRLPSRARLGTLLPYRSELGPVLLCARTVAPARLPSGGDALDAALAGEGWRLRLYFAHGTGEWHPFAELSLSLATDQDDEGLRFDAVRSPLPGADSYPWVRAVRQPSYRLAQRRS